MKSYLIRRQLIEASRIARSISVKALLIASFLIVVMQSEALATAPPTFSATTGVLSRPTQTQLSMTAEPGAEIRYTLDGSQPNPTNSSIYTSPIALGPKNVIKAIAVLASVPSAVTTAFIQNDPTSQPVPRNGLQLWLKEFGPLTSGSNVTEWVDLSGSSNNASQATTANQPTYVSSGLNDFPSVRFDGSNDSLSLSSGLGPDLTAGASIFAVIKPSSTSNATFLTSGNAGPSDQVSVQTLNTQAQLNAFAGTTGSSLTTPTNSLTVGKFQVLSAVHSGSGTTSIKVNGYDIASGAVSNLNNVGRSLNFIGANDTLSTFWNGEIAELLCYTRPVTVEERAALEAYLSSKYQMQTAQSTPPPVLNIATGTFGAPPQVAIAAGADSEVYITTDGTTPSAASPLYSGPFSANYTQNVQAIAIRNGISSSVVSVMVTLDSNKYPAPDPLDTRALNINVDLPTVAIPQ